MIGAGGQDVADVFEEDAFAMGEAVFKLSLILVSACCIEIAAKPMEFPPPINLPLIIIIPTAIGYNNHITLHIHG